MLSFKNMCNKMKKYLIILLIIGIILIFITNCDDNPNDITNTIITPYDNTPVIVNTINAFTFTLNAFHFSIERIDSLSFDADSLVVTLNLANYSSGGGNVTIFNADTLEIFNESLDENKVVIITDIIGNIPKYISFQLSNFSGCISFVLARQE